MILLKQLITEIKVGESIDIGDGYILKNTGDGRFKVYFGDDLALSVNVVFKNFITGMPNTIPWISDADVVGNHKGRGLYRRILPILKNMFGAIRSDNRRNITNDAEKAWKSVGARHTSSNDNINVYGNSQYVLEK